MPGDNNYNNKQYTVFGACSFNVIITGTQWRNVVINIGQFLVNFTFYRVDSYETSNNNNYNNDEQQLYQKD